MSDRPRLERWSWVAGIVGTLIAVSSYVASCTGTQDKSSVEASSRLARRLPDIFRELRPGSSVEKMKSLLGAPHAQGAALAGLMRILKDFQNQTGDRTVFNEDPRRQYSYRFDDAYVQFRSEDGETISETMVLTRNPRFPAHIPVHPTDIRLGVTTIDDLRALGAKIESEHSAIYGVSYAYGWFGAQGMYLHYYYGNMETVSIDSPRGGVLNFAAITSRKLTSVYFDWQHAQ